MIHVMIDIETLAKDSAIPVLLSIGAVKFDDAEIVERFHVGVEPEDCQRCGLEIEAGTVAWWLDNKRQKARDQMSELAKIDLHSALHGFAEWVAETPADQLGSVWSNGSNFDNAKLKAIFLKVGLDWPFGYKQEECYRTMCNRFPFVPFVRVGVHHGAVDDAESQAGHLQAICAVNLIGL